MGKKSPAPKWSEADTVLGDRFLAELHELGGTFDTKKDEATKRLSGDGLVYLHYYELPSAVRSYVSHKAALSRKHKDDKRKAEALQQHVTEALASGEGLPGPVHEGMTQAEIEAAS